VRVPAGTPDKTTEDKMPSTHLSLHYHLIFSTKDRAPLMQKVWRGRLHSYMGGIINDMGGVAEKINGIEDHVHLLVGLRATHRLADVLRDLKSSSSLWVHQELRMPTFAWQEGYGAFTVSASRRAAVKQYIDRQEEHHRQKSFQEEYIEFLEEYGVEYDEQYLW
jgi:REP element-mobilizing transposase RayT